MRLFFATSLLLLLTPLASSAQKLQLDYEARLGGIINFSTIRGNRLELATGPYVYAASGQMERTGGWYWGGGVTYNHWEHPLIPSFTLTAEYLSQFTEWYVYSDINSVLFFREGRNGIRLTPGVSFNKISVGSLSLYQRIGVGFFRPTSQYANLVVQDTQSYFKQENFSTLQIETGVGYHDFFLTIGYNFGLKRSASGKTPDYKPYHQRYHTLHIGLAYHPKLTKRLNDLIKKEAGSKRRSSGR